MKTQLKVKMMCFSLIVLQGIAVVA